MLRWDASFPTLYHIRQRGLISTPIAYATAHLAAIFIKHFPRDLAGVIGPESLPAETRRDILAGCPFPRFPHRAENYAAEKAGRRRFLVVSLGG